MDPKLSYQKFRIGYLVGIVVFTAIMVWSWCLQVERIDCMYLFISSCEFSLLFSVVFFRLYVRKYHRTLIGIAMASVICPTILQYVFYHIVTTFSGEVLLSCICCLMIIILIFGSDIWDYERILSSVLAGRVSVWLRMPIYHFQREWLLKKQQKQWKGFLQKYGINKIKMSEWSKIEHIEKVRYIEKMIWCEQNMLDFKETVHIESYIFKSFRDKADFYIDPDNQCVVWNEILVDSYPLHQILESMIRCLQQYQWYNDLNEEERTNLKRQSKKVPINRVLYWNFILYEHLSMNRNILAYDLLTGHYACYKTDWYCNLNCCENVDDVPDELGQTYIHRKNKVI